LTAKTFNTFGVVAIDDEPHYHKHIRNLALPWACQAHLESCLAEANEKFNELIDGTRTGFTSDHESNIYCNGVLNGTEKEFRFLWNSYEASTVTPRRRFYLQSIGCIENEEILSEFIGSIVEKTETVKQNDEWLTIVQATYANGPIGMNVTMKFLRTDYDYFIGL
jgi:hypothetical protein